MVGSAGYLQGSAGYLVVVYSNYRVSSWSRPCDFEIEAEFEVTL